MTFFDRQLRFNYSYVRFADYNRKATVFKDVHKNCIIIYIYIYVFRVNLLNI